jgi:Protein of unknown function (DUF4231)
MRSEGQTLETSHAVSQFFRTRHICCPLRTASYQILLLLNDLQGLSFFQKQTLVTRYISITEEINKRRILYAWLFHIGRTIVTIGSLIVPALLSIQYSNPALDTSGIPVSSIQIYWTTWVISLLVTMWNGILTLFKVDKKYFFLHTVLEHLQSELWQYIYLTSKYGGHYTKGKEPTHANQFQFVCHNLEKIKLKQVEEEYYKLLDNPSGVPTDKHTVVDVSGSQVDPSKVVGGMFVPTPSTDQLLQKQVELAKATGMVPKNTLHPIQERQPNVSSVQEQVTSSSQEPARRRPTNSTLTVSV